MIRRALIPTIAWWLAGALLLAGCAAPRPPLAAPKAHAIELNNQAIDLFERHDYARALISFQQALAQEQAIEDEDGIARNWLNLSLVYQRMGRTAEAEQALDNILQERKIAFSDDHRAQAALRKGLLAAQRNARTVAGQWLEQAEGYCAARCPLLGKLLNFRARLELDTGRAEQAAQSARLALASNRTANDKAEIANALRLQASADLRMNNPGSAIPSLQEALAIDKALGASGHIHQDLMLLGEANADRPAMAETYRERARGVARAMEGLTVEQDAGNGLSGRSASVAQ